MFYVGLDLGKMRDYSALAVVEREDRLCWTPAIPSPPVLRVRHLERFPLGTPYMRVVARVSELRTRTCAVPGACGGVPLQVMTVVPVRVQVSAGTPSNSTTAPLWKLLPQSLKDWPPSSGPVKAPVPQVQPEPVHQLALVT